MNKKSKLPKVSDKEIEDLTLACEYAYGNDAVDTFLDKVFAEARRLKERREAHGKQTRAE